MHFIWSTGLSNIYHTEFQRNKKKGRGAYKVFWQFIVCIFLSLLSIYFGGKRSLHGRKMDIDPFRKFYGLTHQKITRRISIELNCLQSCLFTKAYPALICHLAPQRKEHCHFVSVILEITLWEGRVMMPCD